MKKAVSFKNNQRDLELLEYVNTKMNFSAYVKELILKDMEHKEVKEVILNTPYVNKNEPQSDDSLGFEW